jgi:hypothetical protein
VSGRYEKLLMLQTPTLRAKTVKYTVPRVAQDEGVESSACDIVAVGSHKVAEDGILDSVVNDGNVDIREARPKDPPSTVKQDGREKLNCGEVAA